MAVEQDKLQEWTQKQNVGVSALDPAPKDTWQILYWPALNSDGKVAAGAGRAEYLRVIFEYAGVQYQDVSSHVHDYFWSKKEVQNPEFPVLAPPAIRRGEFALSQTAICAKYIAMQFGLYPKNPEYAAKAEQIVTTVHEYIAEGRMAFHPVKNTMSYYDQVEEAKPFINDFKKERLPRYMDNFERLLRSNKDGAGYFIGDEITYVDLQVLVMLQVTEFQWPDAWPGLHIPLLKQLRQKLENTPAIKAYLASPRKQPFAGDRKSVV